MSLLDVDGVTMEFGGVRALAGVSLSLKEGEIVGLIGPNGAGKTTLFNCITGVLDPQQGVIAFDGRALRGMKPHRRAKLGIARTFQNLQLFTGMSVLENVMVPLDAFAPRGMVSDAFKLPRARFEETRAAEHAAALLHLLGLSELAGTQAGELPVGLQRRVELARALAVEPVLLLLDEPAAGLDAAETAELARLLPSIRDRFGLSMLLVDHDMALVMRACDYIYVLDSGRLVATGRPDAVRQDREVVRAYLGETAGAGAA